MARPSKYTDALAREICDRLAIGETIRSICKDDHIPDLSNVMRWLGSNKSFREQYARAREEQADYLAQQIIDISDDSRNDTQQDADGNVIVNHDHIARARLRVDARKWYAGKVSPKKYGDKIEHSGTLATVDVASSLTKSQIESISKAALMQSGYEFEDVK